MKKLKIKLFDSQPTMGQQLIVDFWLLNLGLILFIWVTTADFGSTPLLFDAVGMLFGLLATYFALTQFMLMGRIAWVERQFGLERLARYHRLNGYLAISCILIHPLFITASYALAMHNNLVSQYFSIILHYNYVWLAAIAEILFITVVASSIYIARKRLKFETWYFVHLMVYVAIITASFHQFTTGDSFAGGEHPLARIYWLGIYGFVALNLLIWRFGLSTFNLLRFGFTVDKVVVETKTTTSIYIRGRKIERWRMLPGQFVMVRIFAKGLWWQEHPFSLSWIPHDDLLRITVRDVGDYTHSLSELMPGKRVLVAGPFGRFTREVAQTNKRLFIAAGVGITPIRSLLEEAVRTGQNSVLLYANRTPDDIVFQNELQALAGPKLRIHHIISRPPKAYRGEAGHVDVVTIKRLVLDYKQRDIYLCGPLRMLDELITALMEAGVAPERLHFERFNLHAQ
jgi:predicted ferric reductase